MHRFEVIVLAPVLGLLSAVGCVDGPQRVGAQPSWRDPGTTARAVAAGPVTFAPDSEPVVRYNDPPGDAPHAPLEDAVVAALDSAAVQAGVPAPAPDARLFRACAELAAVVPDDGVVDYTLVEFALQRQGIIEPSPHLLVVWGDVTSPAQIVRQLQPRLAELLHEGPADRVGVGAVRRGADGSGTVVFALQGSSVSTAPIPRAVPAGATIAIDAAVNPRYRDPEVFVTRDDGGTQQVQLAARPGGGFTAEVACAGHTGRQQIEITASDAAGSTVLANFPVWCATRPPSSITAGAAHDDAAVTAAAAERALFARLNRDRVAGGLAALHWDDRLAEVARRYSEEMHRTQVVAHISPTSGSGADRVRAAGIKTGLVLENLARAYSVDEAHDGLMNSPGHRANAMSTAATEIGIGVALGELVSGRRELFVTQLYTRIPPPIDPVKAVEAVREKLVAQRPHLVHAAELHSLAQQLADRVAAGATNDDAWATVAPKLRSSANASYQRIASVTTATSDLARLDVSELFGTDPVDEVGIGVAQGRHPELGDNTIWIIILLAERRTP